MVAKIVKGRGFKGVVNYILDKAKQTELLAAEGVRYKSRESIIRSLVTQASLNPKVSKPVCHISLDFSAQDREKLTNAKMVQIAKEYLLKMGITNTQYIIGRHHDKEHPHIHIVFNRIDNNGRTITDRNDRYRSEKICKELTDKHGLYFAQGKENVKVHRLKEPDKSRYEIYFALQSAIAKSRNWIELMGELKRSGITATFKYKGSTTEVQGVKFGKNGHEFSGSKVDRQYSYSKIDYQLQQNNRMQETNAQSQSQVLTSAVEAVGSLFGGLLHIPSGSDYDEGQVEWLRQHKKKKKSIRHGL